MQKQPTEPTVLKKFAIFTGKHLCWSLFFNKVAGLQVLRTPILENNCENGCLRRNWNVCFRILERGKFLECHVRNVQKLRCEKKQVSKDFLNYLRWVVINSNFSYFLLVSLFVSRHSISLFWRKIISCVLTTFTRIVFRTQSNICSVFESS